MAALIETPRLRLLTLGPAVLRAVLAGEREEAEARLGARLPASWHGLEEVLRVRLEQVSKAPDQEAWLTRAMELKSERRVIGVAGFHGPPGGAWLRDVAPDGAEFGYTVFEGHRRRGYAAEAGRGLVDWALVEHGVRRFVLSMAPGNEASARVAARLGFEMVGEWIHPVRGLEHVYRRDLDAGSAPRGSA